MENFFFDQTVKNNLTTYNIRKIATGGGDNYTTWCLLNYPHLEKYFELNEIDLSKQQKLDVNLKAIQLISFTGNLENDATMLFVIAKAKETVLDFSIGTVKVWQNINTKWLNITH